MRHDAFPWCACSATGGETTDVPGFAMTSFFMAAVRADRPCPLSSANSPRPAPARSHHPRRGGKDEEIRAGRTLEDVADVLFTRAPGRKDDPATHTRAPRAILFRDTRDTRNPLACELMSVPGTSVKSSRNFSTIMQILIFALTAVRNSAPAMITKVCKGGVCKINFSPWSEGEWKRRGEGVREGERDKR